MNKILVRTLLAGLALGMVALPADAQRRDRERDRGRSRNESAVRVDFRLENGRPAVRLVKYDRSYYGPTGRSVVSLRRLARIAPPAFRRTMREHRELHRDMRRLPFRRAERMHEQWHRQKGWSHREFVEIERW